MTFEKFIINMFITLFIAGVALGFLLATEKPYTLTQQEKYLLFESCGPYFDPKDIPKTLDEFENWNLYEEDANKIYLSESLKTLHRFIKKIDYSKTSMEKSSSVFVRLYKLNHPGYAYYRNKKLLAFIIEPVEKKSSLYFCKYYKNGKLLELTNMKALKGYADYDYKGHLLKSQSHKGWFFETIEESTSSLNR